MNSLPKKASVEKSVLHLVSQSLGFVSVVTDVLLKLVPPKYVTKKMLGHLQGDISDIYIKSVTDEIETGQRRSKIIVDVQFSVITLTLTFKVLLEP